MRPSISIHLSVPTHFPAPSTFFYPFTAPPPYTPSYPSVLPSLYAPPHSRTFALPSDSPCPVAFPYPVISPFPHFSSPPTHSSMHSSISARSAISIRFPGSTHSPISIPSPHPSLPLTRPFSCARSSVSVHFSAFTHLLASAHFPRTHALRPYILSRLCPTFSIQVFPAPIQISFVPPISLRLLCRSCPILRTHTFRPILSPFPCAAASLCPFFVPAPPVPFVVNGRLPQYSKRPFTCQVFFRSPKEHSPDLRTRSHAAPSRSSALHQ